MGRRSSRPSPPRRRAAPSAPRRSSSSTATAPARQSSAQKQSAPPPARTDAGKQAQPPVPAAAAPSAAGGFMANIASTAAGVAIGRGLDRALFGGGSAGGAAEAPDVDNLGPTDNVDIGDSSYSSYATEAPIPDSICSREVLEFKKCLDRSNHHISECQWNLDLLQACQAQAQAMDRGFADAPRL